MSLKYANGNKPLTQEQKEKMITEAAEHYGRYMTSLGFDWKNDPNSSDTPMRVAKAFVNDLAEGVYSNHQRLQRLITLMDMMVWFLKVI